MADQLGSFTVNITANSAPAIQELAKTEAALVKLDRTSKQAQKGFGDLGSASGTAGKQITQLAYALDDLQYGFNAIVNNIPQIAMGLGLGAGVAGAAGIAAVAINQLVKHWGELVDSFQSQWTGETAEGLKMIREKAEEAAKAFDKLLASKTAAEGKQAAGVGKAIIEGPTQAIQAGLLVALQGDALQPKIEERHFPGEELGGLPVSPDVARQTREADQRVADEALIKRLIGESKLEGKQGDWARGQMKRLAEKNPGAFPQGFASDIEAASPEGQKRQSDFEKNLAARKKVEADIKKNVDEHTQKAEKHSKENESRLKEIDDRERKKLEEQKKLQIQGLQDQEKAIMRQKHQIGEDLWQATHEQRPGQTLGSAKAVVDMYQAGTRSQKELAMKAHRLQEEANKRLDKIKDAIEAKRREPLVLAR